ncbi:IS4 family transposase [Thermophagus sp. OGC60D27]|uniref:IS4 family transposase n=1 Tax=Thermophagus sp. OGC60D27 TaxID=3458415 RepID=UPI004037FD9A
MFDNENILTLSKSNGFIKRLRKVRPIPLIEAVLFSNEDPSKVSLNDIAMYLNFKFGIKLTRQAIKKRFNKNATIFLKQLLEGLLHSNLEDKVPSFTQSCFERIIIKDSTCNQLPDHFKSVYPGSGGSGSKSAVRIQFEYDLKNLKVLELSVSSFNHQDLHNAKETIAEIDKNDLVLRDMGYVSLEVLKLIDAAEAWYISRLKPNMTKICDTATGKLLDFSKIEQYMRKNNLSLLEKEVLIGEEKYKTRLVIELIPDQVKAERIRKAEKNAKKKNRQISKQRKAKFGLNLFLTNCSPNMISACELRRIYGIRWQIEMIFKAWKQNIPFHKIKKMSIDRYEFLLYSKLIIIILQWKFYQIMDIISYTKRRRRVSPLKIYKAFRLIKEKFIDIMRGNKGSTRETINRLLDACNFYMLHDDRKGRINWRSAQII